MEIAKTLRSEELIELLIWADFFKGHTNDTLRGCAVFLYTVLEMEPEAKKVESFTPPFVSRRELREVVPWATFFKAHSSKILQDLGAHLSEWLEL